MAGSQRIVVLPRQPQPMAKPPQREPSELVGRRGVVVVVVVVAEGGAVVG